MLGARDRISSTTDLQSALGQSKRQRETKTETETETETEIERERATKSDTER